MNIIIPMAGEGQRFKEAGYKESKPSLPTVDRRTGNEIPMVVCAVKDLPGVEPGGENIIFIERDFHQTCGVEKTIKSYYPLSKFIVVDRLTEGQASSCMLAKELVDTDIPLLIAGCDNGMVFDIDRFQKMTEISDVLIFTFRDNSAVLRNPNEYGWVGVEDDIRHKVKEISVKKAISENPTTDHAIVSSFWFKHGCDFVKATKKMIRENDRVNGEFYVDQVMKHCLELNMDVRVFEIDRYISWGTPKDYKNYQISMRYWKEFTDSEAFLPRLKGEY